MPFESAKIEAKGEMVVKDKWALLRSFTDFYRIPWKFHRFANHVTWSKPQNIILKSSNQNGNENKMCSAIDAWLRIAALSLFLCTLSFDNCLREPTCPTFSFLLLVFDMVVAVATNSNIIRWQALRCSGISPRFHIQQHARCSSIKNPNIRLEDFQNFLKLPQCYRQHRPNRRHTKWSVYNSVLLLD